MARISYNGTTNSQGVASATITGQGKGRLRFISKCGDLWSNEIEIDDYLFYDKAVTGSANPNWYDNNYGTVNVGSDGTLLTSKNTTIFLMHNASNDSHTSSDQYIWNTPFVVEFDVVSMSGTGTDTQFQVYSDETTKNWATGLSGVGHYKAIVFDGNQRLYKDEELQTNQQSYSLPNCRITLRVRNNVSLKYKNFMIYPVFSAPKHYTPISLSSSSSIIQTGESATLSATLTNVLGEPMANTSVNFIEDGTVIATAPTNSQGVASTSINSKGTGERTFKASKDNVESETITITDNGYIYYHEEEITSSVTSDNYKILATLSELPLKFELSFDYKTNTEARFGLFDVNNFVTPNNPNYSVFVGSPNGSSKWYYGVRTTSTNTTDVSASPTDYHHYTIRRDGDTFYYQRDGTGSYSKSASWFDNYHMVIGLLNWGTSGKSSVKNIILRSIE